MDFNAIKMKAQDYEGKMTKFFKRFNCYSW